jgi:hydroxyacylglutathione hydrolase
MCLDKFSTDFFVLNAFPFGSKSRYRSDIFLNIDLRTFLLTPMFFKQIQQHGDNFSYIIADEVKREAAVVDPSYNAGEIGSVIKAENLKLKYVINTHSHSDHTAGNEELRSLFNAEIVAHELSKAYVDIRVNDGDFLKLGNLEIEVIYTPGHTPDSICLMVNQKLFTGDTLFVGECGRTDLPGGNARSMYHSLFFKLLKLDDQVEVYPGHDYGSSSFSSIGKEKRENYTLRPRSLVEFIEFMKQP